MGTKVINYKNHIIMTKKYERRLRGICKFLKHINEGDISTQASILTLEAEIIEGRDVNKHISTLINGLNDVKNYCDNSILKLKELMKEE